MSESASVISIQGVSKAFGQGAAARVLALENINLEVQAGEFIALLGPSGCGKSTLLRVIGDLISPTTGQVRVNGKPAPQARRDRDYGMVFQQATLYEWRSVSQNVQLPLEVMRYPKAQREARAQEMLRLVQLGDFGRHYPWQLSGGMQQRVAIARALAFSPSLLLMDEPFGALDEMTREHMQLELLHIWSQTRTTVVFVTHSIPEAVFLASRVVVMSPRPGRVAGIIAVDLPRPRGFDTREAPRFFEKITEVREVLRREEGPAAGTGAGA
ncbi:MAG: ABC transporter ATP-binding protein [Anaerolineales bacterium]|nr:ABC transporter ATP-binding protein [Anaerolineales bacterium]